MKDPVDEQTKHLSTENQKGRKMIPEPNHLDHLGDYSHLDKHTNKKEQINLHYTNIYMCPREPMTDTSRLPHLMSRCELQLIKINFP